MSWAAHEFETYVLQRKVGIRASYLAIVLGTFAPDLLTKYLVYESSDPAQFHRGWPGVGGSHSLLFGFVLAVLVLATTRSRGWALGLLIGQWAHVVTDIADTAGVMPFFPFSTEPVSIAMWKYAAQEGRYGDAVGYYSSLGVVWDAAWLLVLVVVARRTLGHDYFQTVVVPADPTVWGWISRRLHVPESGLLLLYRGFAFYGVGRMASWFLYARVRVRAPFQPVWGGPRFLPGVDLSDADWFEVVARTALGGVAFTAFLGVCWIGFVRRLWVGAGRPAAVTPVSAGGDRLRSASGQRAGGRSAPSGRPGRRPRPSGR
jgi:membrane-bound metal-dependent hydrolase YbcI (DUF457 family)